MSLSRKVKVGGVLLVAGLGLLFVVASAALVVKPACGCANPDLRATATATSQVQNARAESASPMP